MVIYDLQCENQHQFEGWFRNAQDLESQQASGLLICPVCESAQVRKKVTAAKVTRKSNSLAIAPSVSANEVVKGSTKGGDAPTYQQLQRMLSKVHNYIDNNFTDVGNKFADEALKIHRGEKEADNIRGVASKTELKELAEEGVSAVPLPPKPVDKEKLN